MNDFGSETVTTVRKEDLKAKGDKIEYEFPPPPSFTLIKGKIE